MQCMKKLSLVVAVISLGAIGSQAHAGAITVYTALEEDEIAAYLKAANAAMPDLKVNVLRLSTGDLGARLIAEASNPQQDVIWGFAVSNMLDPRLQNLLEPYAVKGMDALPARYKGADNKWFAATGYVAAFCVNTDRLKSKNLPMPTSWEDLTKPAYKGEIVIPSPAASGTGYLQIAALLQGLGKEKGWALLKDLDKNVAQYTPSGSRPCKMARAGEYAIGVSFAFPAMQSIEEGYPIKMVIPSKWVGYELEASGLMKTAKNPADAKRFLDWTLSQQAGGLYSKYKELVTIPGAAPNKAAEAAGLPKDLGTVLYPVDFQKSAAERDAIIKTWQETIKR
ncbi:ABC transporter substrate-binding protein [Achromobacter pulmonis]|uniref:ABC transporter substrate-binding protein n=1 Tax=Achromobacter pulmonis TaxID=1389932 RepID=UPI0026A80722